MLLLLLLLLMALLLLDVAVEKMIINVCIIIIQCVLRTARIADIRQYRDLVT